MTHDCAANQERLGAAVLGGRDATPDPLAPDCTACAAHLADLHAIAATLDVPAEALAPERARAVRRHVAAELAGLHATTLVASRTTSLPAGYARELARILAWSLVPLPAALLVYALLFRFGGALVAALLPEAAAVAVGVATALAASSWLALVYGALPFVAHRRALAREREVSA